MTLLESAQAVLTIPTAPFREGLVLRFIEQWCESLSVPFTEDHFENLWVNVASEEEIRNKKLLLVAHMDHPGAVVYYFFEEGGRTYAKANWQGGGPSDLTDVKMVLFANNDFMVLRASVKKFTLTDDNHPAQLLLELEKNIDPDELIRVGRWGACLWFDDLPKGYEERQGRLRTKSADDTLSVVVLLTLIGQLEHLEDVAFLFSRSEERGEIGSFLAAAAGYVNMKTPVVILDLMDPKTESELGQGVVLRLRDKGTIYTPQLVEKVLETAQSVKEIDPTFKYRMSEASKGSTDATAFEELGYVTTAVGIPLWYYHNKDKEGKPFPEEVDLQDIESLIKLLQKLTHDLPSNSDSVVHQEDL